MILTRRAKSKGVGWLDSPPVEDVQLRSLDTHGIHGGQQIEVYRTNEDENDSFRMTMAVASTLIYGNGIIFKGFVPEDEQNWDYQYHVEEWTLKYGESS